MAEKWHSGISMHKLSIGSGFIGLVFTVGCALIFLLGLPQLWYFVAFSAVLGVGIAFFFRWTSDRRFERRKPLSILHAAEKADTSNIRVQDRGRTPLLAQPRPCTP
jgi:hypothetical protein